MKYDLIIAGAGTSGCACAYTSAKLGLKTLLVEKNSFAGGTMTSSLVIPAMKTSENAINTDFFNNLYFELEKIGGAITYCDGNKGWFNPELLKITLDKMLTDVSVDILYESEIENIEKILSGYNVTIHTNNLFDGKKVLLPPIETKYLVDATGDGKICEILNYKFLENKNNFQPCSLRFILSNVDTKRFAEWITDYDKDRDVTTCTQIDGRYYFSTACTWDTTREWALKPLFKQAIADGMLTEEDSNYFQLFSVAGTPDAVAFNAPRIINSPQTPSTAYIEGRKSIFRLYNFCKKYLKGFENSYISSIANSLGVRVSRCVKGRYVYTGEDLKSGKSFEHPVAISDYPIDIHSDKKDSSSLKKVLKEYQLPLESLIADDSLFVIGRCISADFEAQGALRIIPTCFSMGEGLAKHLADKMG